MEGNIIRVNKLMKAVEVSLELMGKNLKQMMIHIAESIGVTIKDNCIVVDSVLTM